VTVEDLLGRDPVPPIPELMSKTTSGKSVLVTGAGGSIGYLNLRGFYRQERTAKVQRMVEIVEEIKASGNAALMGATQRD
jgi:FlaA1/EpsC-like NDP-sugar epimerase